MTFLRIPTRSDFPSYRFRIDLEAVSYEMRFRYNLRMNRWILDISSAEGTPIRSGIVLLTETDFFPYLKSSLLPPGDFVMVHETLEQINAGREDLGNSIQLFYNEAN